MIKKYPAKPLFIGFVLVFSLFYCERAEQPISGTVLAKVGKAYLFKEDISHLIPEDFTEEQKNDFIQQLRDKWVKKELLVQEAERLKLNKSEVIQKRIEASRKDVLSQAVREQWLANSDCTKVSLTEVQAFYENNKSQFMLQERHIQFRHIRTADLESSKAAKNALMRGIPFEKVVEMYALDKATTLSESQIYYPIQLACANFPDLNKYLQIIGINEISQIRLLDGKYHFVQLTDDRPEGTLPDIDWISERIKEWLLLEKKRKIISSLEREIYLKAQLNNEITLY